MELRIDINYNQILKLIHQLPKKKKEQLYITLKSEIETEKTSDSLQSMIINAPTWTDSELKDYEEARNHINQSRIA